MDSCIDALKLNSPDHFGPNKGAFDSKLMSNDVKLTYLKPQIL